MAIEMTPIEGSTSIKSYGYDEATGTLAVEFTSGATYHYAQVPKEVAEGFAAADSAGAYFRHEIRGAFHGERQAQPEEEGGEDS